jgi:hypothetical protein
MSFSSLSFPAPLTSPKSPRVEDGFNLEKFQL